MRYLFFYLFSLWRCFQITYRKPNDKSYDMFQFVCLLVRLDERLIFADDLSLFVNLYDSDLDRFIFGDIESGRFEIKSDVSIFVIE